MRLCFFYNNDLYASHQSVNDPLGLTAPLRDMVAAMIRQMLNG
jgi:hypothetical protein